MFNNAKNGVLQLDDTTSNYISFGKGKKNLIIIPGLGDGFKTVKGLAIPFSILYKRFAKDFKVYVFSRKNVLPINYTTKDMADDIIKSMDLLNIETASVLGVSQGGMIAQYLAINHPNRIEKLVLTVTVPYANDMINQNVDLWLKFALEKNFKAIMIDTAKKSYTGKYLKKNIRNFNMFSFLLKPKSFERFIIQAQACKMHNAINEIGKIKAKTLIIAGKKDLILGYEGSKILHEKIENSSLLLYEEYSHGLYEQAKDFNEKVYNFLISE